MTELGQRLKQARNEKNMTLDQLQQVTKIQKRYLEAIEEGNYEIMPGKFYARAFLKQYAEAVELDPDELFEEFSSDIPVSSNHDIPETLSRVQSRKTPVSADGFRFFNILPRLLTYALIIGVLVAIWYFFQGRDVPQKPVEQEESSSQVEREVGSGMNEEERIEEEPRIDETEKSNEKEITQDGNESVEEPVKPEQKLTLIETTDGDVPYSIFELSNTASFNVKIHTTKRAYIGIENGKGKSFLSKTLDENIEHSFDFSEEAEIEFNIGNALGLQLLINDKVFTYPVEPKEKVHQKIKIVYKDAN